MSAGAVLLHTSGLETNSFATNFPPPPTQRTRSLTALLVDLLRHPGQVLRLWNWKSALLSIMLRGPIFLIAGWRQSWKVALAALLTESFFCAASAGFYGAIVQSLMDAEPEWLTGVLLAAIVPLIFQVFEYLLHWFRGTPHLRIAEIVSVFVSGISALFNWYAMRRGTLLVGGKGGSFGGDLKRLPRLLFNFFAGRPRRIATGAKNRSLEVVAGICSVFFLRR